jgi:cysteine desulfurase
MKPGETPIDSYATSGHKLHAPKGVGALYLRAGGNFAPPMPGGGQERGVRSGTENVAYIAAYAKAVELEAAIRESALEATERLRARLLDGLRAIEGVRVHSPADGYPGILIFSMPSGLRSQVMLNYLDAEHGVMVSNGSACKKGQDSYTLTAMGLPADQVETALRASFDSGNTEADIDALLEGLRQGVEKLARARVQSGSGSNRQRGNR